MILRKVVVFTTFLFFIPNYALEIFRRHPEKQKPTLPLLHK